MGLREQIYEKSQGLVKREPVTLPECGEVVLVRTLMSGDLLRANSMGDAEQGHAVYAFAVEDPGNPGQPIYNWNDMEHRKELHALHPNDLRAVIDKHNVMLGIAAKEAEGN